jgi:hypothetical protein
METWQATIKERGNDHLLTPSYSISETMFGHIKDERQREYEMRKFLIEFWGLNNTDVEWHKLEKV